MRSRPRDGKMRRGSWRCKKEARVSGDLVRRYATAEKFILRCHADAGLSTLAGARRSRSRISQSNIDDSLSSFLCSLAFLSAVPLHGFRCPCPLALLTWVCREPCVHVRSLLAISPLRNPIYTRHYRQISTSTALLTGYSSLKRPDLEVEIMSL